MFMICLLHLVNLGAFEPPFAAFLCTLVALEKNKKWFRAKASTTCLEML